MASMWRDIAGDTTRNRVLEYFLTGRELEHSLNDVLYEIPKRLKSAARKQFKIFVKKGWLLPTRKKKGEQLYKLAYTVSTDNAVKAFDAVLENSFYWLDDKGKPIKVVGLITG